MARNGPAWFERGRLAFGHSRKNKTATDNPAHPSRIDVARRFIADINNHPHLTNGRDQADPVQIIDLACIREALGVKWSSYSEVIHRIATRTIEKHLDSAHTYARRDDCYVLTFKGAQLQTARDRTRAISLALATYLFGTGKNDAEPMAGRGRPSKKYQLVDARGRLARIFECVKSVFRLRRAVTSRLRTGAGKDTGGATTQATTGQWSNEGAPARIGNDTNLDGMTGGDPSRPPGGAMPHGNVSPADHRASAGRTIGARHGGTGEPHAAANRGATRSASPAPSVSPLFVPSPSSLSADHVAPSRPTVQAQAHSASTNGHAAPQRFGAEATPPVITADLTPPSQPEPFDADEINALENAMIAAADRLARESARHGFAPPIRGLHYFYRPMWSVRTNMMAISSCVPIARLPSGEMVTGAAVVPQGASSDFLQMLDHAALTHVLSDGQKLAEAERSTLVSIPVHCETLCDKERRAAYIKMCHGLPPGARRRILFECLGVQQGMGQSQLVAGLMALKPFCALTVGQLPLDTSNFTFWKTSGLSSVGVDIYDQMGSGNGGETELIERLERFVFFTSQSGLRSYVRGLSTLSLAAAAVAAGFDFVEGGIIQDQIEPSDVRSFTLEDLYLQFAGARRAPSRIAS